MRHRAVATTLGLTLLMVLSTISPLPAADEAAGPIPDRTRLSHRSHDPYFPQLSPNGEWIVYSDHVGDDLYVVEVASGNRRSLGDGQQPVIQFTPDESGVVVRASAATPPLLRRRGLGAGPLESPSNPLSVVRPFFTTTFDGRSVAYVDQNDSITWWDEDGSLTPLVTVDGGPDGIAGAPDRDIILYTDWDPDTYDIDVFGVTSAGQVIAYGTIPGMEGFVPAEFTGVNITFLPHQDRAIVALNLRDSIYASNTAWIVDLTTDELEFAAPAFVHHVSPDGSMAFFEVDASGGDYGRIVPIQQPSQAIDLPVNGRRWVIHPDWTYLLEDGLEDRIYDLGGTLVRTVDAQIDNAVFAEDDLVFSTYASTPPYDATLYSEPILGGARRTLSLTRDSVWPRGAGNDGFVYWAETNLDSTTVWRSMPDGKWRARISKPTAGSSSFSSVADDGTVLVFEGDGTLWAIDLAALPKYSCVDLLATHIGTAKRDVIDGTAGNDVIVTLGGNDVIRAGDGRDRICAGNGDDRLLGDAGGDWLRGGNGDDELLGKSGDDNIKDKLGTNDINGGPGTDLCKATGVMINCEKP